MSKEYHQSVYAPPKGAADLLLIRHGRTEAAREGELFAEKDGHGDPALHPEGERQAILVGERLKDDAISAIYVTKLRRTHQTAAPLAAHLGLTPVEDPDLHEVHLGHWDRGEYRIRAAEGAPEFMRAAELQEWGEIPGAETTEALHARVRRSLWGYASDEALDNEALIREQYRGIRPAPGYPACPDHTEKRTLFDLLDAPEHTGVTLTESCAMWPASAVSGLYFAHPEAAYFGIGRIGPDQVADYAERKGMKIAEVEAWLQPSLSYTPDKSSADRKIA